MKTKIQALVLSITEYKEKDGLVKVLTADSILTLYARGLFKPNSKNLRIVQPFSYNEFMIEDKMKMPLLLHGHTIHYYYHIQENLLKSSCCFVLHDLIQRTRKEENLFNVLLDCWNSADKDLDDFYFWACIVLKYCIEQEGIQPFVDGCVHCDCTRVETLSQKDGGFLCEKCNHSQYPKWNVEQLKKYRALFKCKDGNLDYLKSHFSFSMDDFIYLAKWMEYHSQKMYPSIQFLESIRGF
ncbi:DNA repair protein RecO [uncultured Holdemanella sp.]|uniref:DNA repair protein RecO n=1 Tax=uncultured Holdemanella sp. TaxID=1763549 RepID=UPI0025D894A5|nr:DNA repair protein RecO [uncultured Holdemanella sp.]